MSTPRILIVEDERIIAEDIKDSLQGFGYEVVGSVGSGERALEVVRDLRPDLAIMDINLDGNYDGTEVAQHFREAYGIPVVYLTAYADEETLKKVTPTVPLGFILKPYNDRDLRSSIEIALYRVGLERQNNAQSTWQKCAFDSLEEGVIAVDEKNKIKFMNCVAENITGWLFVEAHEKSIGEVLDLKRSDASRAISEYINTDTPNRSACVRVSNVQLLQSNESNEIPVDITANPILGPLGEYRGFTILLRESRKKWGISESALEVQQKEMHEEKMQALNELIEGLAHGVNNSLSGSIGFLELLRRNGQIEEEFEKWTDLAISGCQDASALINRVRGVCNSSPQNPMPMELNLLLAEVVNRIDRDINESIHIKFQKSIHPVWILADRQKIEQAIVNVIVNSILALPDGGEISVSVNREVVQEYQNGDGAEGKNNYCVVSIRDNGVGIEPEAISRIFDPFYTTVRDGKIYGKGLGLTITYGTVRAHGGWINVESVKDEGTEFLLYFPEIES